MTEAEACQLTVGESRVRLIEGLDTSDLFKEGTDALVVGLLRRLSWEQGREFEIVVTVNYIDYHGKPQTIGLDNRYVVRS